MIHDVKLEGKNKVKAIALSVALAVVLFMTTFLNDERRVAPKDISDVRVGEHFIWNETVMKCTFTVYNIQSVQPPLAENQNLSETDKLCGSLLCEPSSPVVTEKRRDNYTCYNLSDIKVRVH